MEMEQFLRLVMYVWSKLCEILRSTCQSLDDCTSRIVSTCFEDKVALRNFRKQLESLMAMVLGCSSLKEMQAILALHQNATSWLLEAFPHSYNFIMELMRREIETTYCEKTISLSDERRRRAGASVLQDEGPIIDLARTRLCRPRIRINVEELNRNPFHGKSNDVEETSVKWLHNSDPTENPLDVVRMKIQLKVMTDQASRISQDALMESGTEGTERTSHVVEENIRAPLPSADLMDHEIENAVCVEEHEPCNLKHPALTHEASQPNKEPDAPLQDDFIHGQTDAYASQYQATSPGNMAAVLSEASDTGQSNGGLNIENIDVDLSASARALDESTEEKPLSTSIDSATSASNDQGMVEVTERRGPPVGVGWLIQQPVAVVEQDPVKNSTGDQGSKQDNQSSTPDIKNLNVMMKDDTADDDR